MRRNIEGKRIIVVDDSIVRGTTMKKIVQVLRENGAKEIHLRICSPPITDPCYFGVDTPERKQLIASAMSVPKIRKFIGADSLHFLSLGKLIQASKQAKKTLCTSCFTGKYPMKVNYGFSKKMFENVC